VTHGQKNMKLRIEDFHFTMVYGVLILFYVFVYGYTKTYKPENYRIDSFGMGLFI
jgi:hypothetical protein